jgi:hypothetical protein
VRGAKKHKVFAYRLFLLKTSPRQEPWWFPPNERLESLLKWMKF